MTAQQTRPANMSSLRHAATAGRAATLAAVGATFERQSRRHTARHLAHQLACIYRIPPFESALVPWLSDADCANNADALVEWTRDQLADRSVAALVGTGALLEVLSARLQRRLAASGDLQPW